MRVIPAGYIGDMEEGQTFDVLFNTVVDGVPTTLAGSPAARVFTGSAGDGGTSDGVTLNVDRETGLHSVTVDTSAAGISAGSDCHVVLTAGTVGGSSVANTQIASFSVQNRPKLTAEQGGKLDQVHQSVQA